MSTHKVLGVIIDKDLSWQSHLVSLGKIVSKKVFQLSKIKHFLSEQSRKAFYHAHILSQIDYASTLWDNTSDSNIQLIARLHKRAIKLILLKSSTLNVEDYNRVNILPLKDKLYLNKCVFMHMVVNGLVPPKIANNFTINPNRHNHKISFPRPRNNLFKSSLMFSGGSAWNNLPSYLKQIPMKFTFRKALKYHLLDNLKLP